jgi:hypothetical protein
MARVENVSGGLLRGERGAEEEGGRDEAHARLVDGRDGESDSRRAAERCLGLRALSVLRYAEAVPWNT